MKKETLLELCKFAGIDPAKGKAKALLEFANTSQGYWTYEELDNYARDHTGQPLKANTSVRFAWDGKDLSQGLSLAAAQINVKYPNNPVDVSKFVHYGLDVLKPTRDGTGFEYSDEVTIRLHKN